MIGSGIEYVVQIVAHSDSLPPTDRQLEILTLLALGFSEKEVAVRLGISVRTARNHVANLLPSPGASSSLPVMEAQRRCRGVEQSQCQLHGR